MKQKIGSFFIVIALVFPQAPLAIALEMPAPPADTTGPAFISIVTASSGETEANIVWTTDELAYGFVEYGETASYGLATPKSTMSAMDNAVAISGLSPGTIYHFRIVAEDESGNISYSEDRTLETALEVVPMDSAPPEISQVSAADVSASEATISWATDELAQGKIEYGKTAGYGTATPLATDYATEHSVSLSNLEPDTEYHYRVVARDESGNEAFSLDEIFITDPAPAPAVVFAISHIETASVGTSSATIIWKTNEPASAQVFYGLGETYASSSSVSAANAVSHEVKLAGLKAGANYFYKAASQNVSGETIEKSGFEFNTLYEPKKAQAPAPKISNIMVGPIGTSTAVILFDTDIGATGKINYGPTTAYEKTDGGHLALLTAHSHPLFGLAPDTNYNFVAVVQGANGNETIYENKTFRTLAVENQAAVQEIAATEETVTDQTTEEPESGGGGGGHYSYTRTPTLSAPKFIKVEGLDGQAMFFWNPKKLAKAVPGSTQIRTNIFIVKSSLRYPEGPTFGKIIYKGNSGLFTDKNLENGKIYYYSVFTVNQFNSYSQPARFKVAPKKANEEMELETAPAVVQKNPIYVFPKTLQVGDKNKHVEHLQVLLASAPALYPEGHITGYFGALTEGAVKKFQKRYGLSVTGAADMATLTKLEKLSGIEVASDWASKFESAFSRDLAAGLAGEDVSALQQFLVDAGAYPEALVTGYFGPLTEKAMQRFQKEQNISPPAGYFGKITKKRMLNLIRLRSVSF